MDDFDTDDQRVEAIKRWLAENGKSILVGVGLGVAVVLGWQFWSDLQVGRAERASQHYSALTAAVALNDADSIQQQGEQLLQDFGNSFYAVLAALQLSKLNVAEGDHAKAIEQLEKALAKAPLAEIKTIIRLRLARILLAENRLDEAEAQLDQITDPNFAAARDELKGDLYFARAELDKARAAYAMAQAAGPGRGELLQMKIDSLPAAQETSE